jgi:hypothetical protein
MDNIKINLDELNLDKLNLDKLNLNEFKKKQKKDKTEKNKYNKINLDKLNLDKLNLDELNLDKLNLENKNNKNNENNENTKNNKNNENNENKNKSLCNINSQCVNNVIDLDKNICIVDLSYMTFCRFFAIRRWYEIKMSKDKPKWKIPDDYNWMKDNEFMDKFNKLFFEKLLKLCDKNNIPKYNIIFVSDCKHKDNWRVIKKTDYKSTRKDSHVKNKFHCYKIFSYVRDELIKELQGANRNILLQHDNLEADDVIATLIKYLKHDKSYNGNITIIATDKDYFQICDNNVICCDLSGKNLSENMLKNFNNVKEYLLYKILLGDPSDNISPCYFIKEFLSMANINTKKKKLKATKSTITKVFNNNNTKQLLLDYIEYIRDLNNLSVNELNGKWSNTISKFNMITDEKQFESNAKLIDFENIPYNYTLEVKKMFSQLF